MYGLVYSGLDVGFALSPLVFGWLMDRGWYSATLLGAAVVQFSQAMVRLVVAGLGLFQAARSEPAGELRVLAFPRQLPLGEWPRLPERLMLQEKAVQGLEAGEQIA